MLVIAPPGPLEDRVMRDLPDFLRAGDLLVLNDTRVLAARLRGLRSREGSVASVEATLLRRLGPNVWTAWKAALLRELADVV